MKNMRKRCEKNGQERAQNAEKIAVGKVSMRAANFSGHECSLHAFESLKRKKVCGPCE